MKVYLNSITGIEDAILSMYFSNGKWNEEVDKSIRKTCYMVLTENGERFKEKDLSYEDMEGFKSYFEEYDKMISKLLKIGKRHITLLRFIDLSVTVDGLHRAGQDDWDSHDKRFENRIIRMSTRRNMVPEMSDYYKGKVIGFYDALERLGILLPPTVEMDDGVYVRTRYGYVKAEYKDDPNVLRGLYPLGMASQFTFQCNLTEFAHVYKERRKEGNAHQEVKELCEKICDLLEDAQPMFTRELFVEIKN